MMRSVCSAAVAVATLAVVGMAGIPARMSTLKSPAADAAPTTVAPTTAATSSTTTTTAPATTTTTIVPTTTTMVMTTTTVGRRRVASSTVPTVAIPTPAQAAAIRAHALEVCLELAAANNYRVIAANQAWFQQQLRGISPRPVLGARQRNALEIEQAQARLEIEAQYAIDESNCYLA
jgi:hypothetical protein